MQLELKQGVYSTATSLLGGGIVILAPNVQAVGWVLIGAGVGLFVWGIRINGKRLWQRWWRKDDPTDFAKLALPPKQERPAPIGSKSPLWSRALETTIEHQELISRLAWASHRPPVDTSWPRVHAEAKALIRKLDERLAYVNDALEDRKPIGDWRRKIAQQRVDYTALDNDPLKLLSDEERELVRVAVSDLRDLDGHVTGALAKPRQFPAERVAGMYKHRACKARSTLKELVTAMEAEDEE